VLRIDNLPSPSLEVRDLRVVLAVASAGSTAQAASLLHLTQPAVSRALLAVEEKLGTQLFDRTPRGLVLNTAGERLVGAGARVLGELRELERLVRAPSAPPAKLRIVCECYTAYHWLPSTLGRLRETLPGLTIELAVEHAADPVAALVDERVDAALLTASRIPQGEPLEEKRLFSDEVVFVLAPTHPLAPKQALTRTDLLAHTLLAGRVPAPDARWFMQRVLGRDARRMRLEQLPLTEAIIDMARAGMGVAVLSEWIAQPHLGRGDLVVKRLASGPLRRPWRLAWRRDVRESALRLHGVLADTAPSRASAGGVRAAAVR